MENHSFNQNNGIIMMKSVKVNDLIMITRFINLIEIY